MVAYQAGSDGSGSVADGARSRGAAQKPIRVLLVDDHAILRDTLRLLLDGRADLEIVGEAADGREAIDLAVELRPDVILMDTAMPGLNGIDATEAIHKRLPRTRILMLSGYGHEDRVSAALQAGASGYVLKSSGSRELLEAIRAVLKKSTFLSAALGNGAGTRPRAEQPLSVREREVLQLVAEGLSNAAVAERLVISIKTVEAHKEHIMRKVGVHGTAGLIHYAIRRGMITVESDTVLGLRASD
jgi:two-component system, NarL family, response regulator NreC